MSSYESQQWETFTQSTLGPTIVFKPRLLEKEQNATTPPQTKDTNGNKDTSEHKAVESEVEGPTTVFKPEANSEKICTTKQEPLPRVLEE